MVHTLVEHHAETLAERVDQPIAVPVHEFPQVALALAEIDTLDAALRDVSVTPGGYPVAIDDSPATTHAQLLAAGFAGSMRADQPRPEGTNEVKI